MASRTRIVWSNEERWSVSVALAAIVAQEGDSKYATLQVGARVKHLLPQAQIDAGIAPTRRRTSFSPAEISAFQAKALIQFKRAQSGPDQDEGLGTAAEDHQLPTESEPDPSKATSGSQLWPIWPDPAGPDHPPLSSLQVYEFMLKNYALVQRVEAYTKEHGSDPVADAEGQRAYERMIRPKASLPKAPISQPEAVPAKKPPQVIVLAGLHEKHRSHLERSYSGQGLVFIPQSARDSAIKAKASGRPVVVLTQGVNGAVLRLLRACSAELHECHGLLAIDHAIARVKSKQR